MAFRILSLDGGGMRGIIAARMLQRVEAQLGKPLKNHFDLIAGTSTGSLLAAGIALGLDSNQLLDLYFKYGLEIFPYQSLFSPQRIPLIFKYGISAPKFFDDGLVSVVSRLLENYTLSSITPNPEQLENSLRLLITSYDTVQREPVIFKSWRHDKWYGKSNADLSLWEVFVSSASAPTFFPAHQILYKQQEFSLIDGGVCANNPVSCAVAAAIKLLRQNSDASVSDILQDIKVLSLGTGDPSDALPSKKVRKWGLIQWGLHIADVFMDAPSDIHRYVSEQILCLAETVNYHDAPSYMRLQFSVAGLNLAIDDARPESLERLIAVTDRYLDSAASSEQSKSVGDCLDVFLTTW
jgi:patatin-like phospholipase/acyl hydrolase